MALSQRIYNMSTDSTFFNITNVKFPSVNAYLRLDFPSTSAPLACQKQPRTLKIWKGHGQSRVLFSTYELTSVGAGKQLLPHVQINAKDISSLRLYVNRVFYLSPPSAITVWISVNSASIVGPSCSY